MTHLNSKKTHKLFVSEEKKFYDIGYYTILLKWTTLRAQFPKAST